MKHSSRNNRALRILARCYRKSNDLRAALALNYDTMNDKDLKSREIINSNLSKKSVLVTSEEAVYKVKCNTILRHCFERLRVGKINSDNVAVGIDEVVKIWTPTGPHVLGLQDKIMSDVDELNRVRANFNNSQKSSLIISRIFNRGKKTRDIRKLLEGDDALFTTFIGAYCKYIKTASGAKFELSNLDLLTPIALVLNSFKMPVDGNISHGGFRSFPSTLARKSVDHNFSRLVNGFTHMYIHQSHLMAQEILFKGGGTCIHDFALHIMTYLLTLIVDNASLNEIFISCHDYSTIETSGNRVFVDDSIVLAGLIPHTLTLKQSGKAYISPNTRKELLKREEYYQWVMSYLIINFDELFNSYLMKIKDQKEKIDIVDTLTTRLVPVALPREDTSVDTSGSSSITKTKCVSICIENFAVFNWSLSTNAKETMEASLYVSHHHENHLDS